MSGAVHPDNLENRKRMRKQDLNCKCPKCEVSKWGPCDCAIVMRGTDICAYCKVMHS